MNGYTLSRQWFDFCFENPEKISPTHTALYLWITEQWNRFGQAKKFGLPALHSMQVLGIKSKKTYYKAFNDLIDFGFIVVVQKAKNQNSANIISISAVVNSTSADAPAHTSALDSALTLARTSAGEHKQTNKQINNKQINNSTDKPKKVYPDEVVKIVEDFIQKKSEDYSNHPVLRNPNLDKWFDTVEKLNRIDKHSYTTIREVIRFSIYDSFWCDQIISLVGLRKTGKNGCKKFDNIMVKMNKKSNTGNAPKTNNVDFISKYGTTEEENELLNTAHVKLSPADRDRKDELMGKYRIPYD